MARVHAKRVVICAKCDSQMTARDHEYVYDCERCQTSIEGREIDRRHPPANTFNPDLMIHTDKPVKPLEVPGGGNAVVMSDEDQERVIAYWQQRHDAARRYAEGSKKFFAPKLPPVPRIKGWDKRFTL